MQDQEKRSKQITTEKKNIMLKKVKSYEWQVTERLVKTTSPDTPQYYKITSRRGSVASEYGREGEGVYGLVEILEGR